MYEKEREALEAARRERVNGYIIDPDVLDTAIALMRAAESKDDEAERDYCREQAELTVAEGLETRAFRFMRARSAAHASAQSEMLSVKTEASEQTAKLSLLILSVEAALSRADAEGIQDWRCIRALRKALEAAK